MKILVACEESQAVTKEFRAKGHEAFSCDIIDCSGGHPEWHIKGDVLPLLDGDCNFKTSDGFDHSIVGNWDMIIAFPPCTYLTNAGTRHFSLKCNAPEKVQKRIKLREEAFIFFMSFANADCDKIVIENPVGYMNKNYRKPDQIIHPYYFGDNAKKRTCLWIKGLDKLKYTNVLPEPSPMYICEGEKSKGRKIGWCEGEKSKGRKIGWFEGEKSKGRKIGWFEGMRGIKGGQEERAKARSKTFPGIAKAMAEQWG